MKILFATAPFDGHFNPLTGIAMYLKEQGHDVRWYAGESYAHKLTKLDIRHYPFKRLKEVNQDNVDKVFPERTKIKGAMSRVKFDIRYVFINNTSPYFEDVKEIFENEFDFDILLCDAAYTASHLIKEKLKVPVVAFGAVPLIETSKDVAPYGMGQLPAKSFLGKLKQHFMRGMVRNFVLADSVKQYNEIITSYGLEPTNETIFDIPIRFNSLFLQSGVPGFEYPRRDISKKVQFIGPMLPYKGAISHNFPYQDKLKDFDKVIVISQGTVDNKEPEKLIIPSLNALKDKNYLLIVATGHSKTEELRKCYSQDNILIEDFVDFDFIMKHADLLISNGGYGSVLLALSNGVPVVVAGIHEGKNEINARVEYFNLGVNLRTEKPTPTQISRGVEQVFTNPTYKQNVFHLKEEFEQYNPNTLVEKYIDGLLWIKNKSMSV